MTTASPFEDLPTDASMRLLSEIHDLSVRSNEMVGVIQAFQRREIKLNGGDILRTLEQCKNLLKEQVAMSVQLVEKQCQLDDRLRAMTAAMGNSKD